MQGKNILLLTKIHSTTSRITYNKIFGKAAGITITDKAQAIRFNYFSRM